MYKIISFILVACSLAGTLLSGCAVNRQKQNIASVTADNLIIKELYEKDIQIRELDAKTDTVNLEYYDKKHREQIFQLLAENKVITAKDKFRAALILQHTAAKFCDGELTSISPENFLMAYKLSTTALSILENGNDTITLRKGHIQRMVALNYDRYLLYSYGYQKFGTQFVFDDKTEEMLLAPIDTTLASDAERAKYYVEPMHMLLKKHRMKPMPNR
jgi:outer membrane murein-binding lipoprotein Lpp